MVSARLKNNGRAIRGVVRKAEMHERGVPRGDGYVAFAATFGLIALLEIGDKTQFTTISLAARHRWPPVLLGAALGLVVVTAIGAALGAALAGFFERWLWLVKIAGGAFSVAFGVWTYLHPAVGEGEQVKGQENAFVEAFSLNFVAELGDKTQIAVILLAATTEAPISVFLGGSAALTLIAVTSVAVGATIARYFSEKWTRIISSVLFVATGVWLIADGLSLTILGVRL